jgi:hypothetical protein
MQPVLVHLTMRARGTQATDSQIDNHTDDAQRQRHQQQGESVQYAADREADERCERTK